MAEASTSTRDLYILTIFEAIMQLTEYVQLYRNLTSRLDQNQKDDDLRQAGANLLEQIRRTEGHAHVRLKALDRKTPLGLNAIDELRHKTLGAALPDRHKLNDLIIEYHALVIDKFDLSLPTSNIQQVSQLAGNTNEPRT